MTIATRRCLFFLLACGLGSGLHAVPAAAQVKPSPARDGRRDFDFEFGSWTTQLSRLVKPLTGSTTWVSYEGSSVVRRVWNGRANLGELDVTGPAGHIQGLSLRLYNPESHQWRISWANAADGLIGEPMSGEFKDGRGVFYNQEPFTGRMIFVRFIFADITTNSFRFEQAFSDDGGKTWEVNWKASFTRVQ
jgi:hypothetical protein